MRDEARNMMNHQRAAYWIVEEPTIMRSKPILKMLIHETA